MRFPSKKVMGAALALGVVAALVTALPALAAVPTFGSYSAGSGTAGVTAISINGTGFWNGGVSSAVTSVTFGGGAVAAYTVPSDILINVTSVPCAAVTGGVTVTTTGGSVTGTSFTVNSQGAPTVLPATGAVGATVAVTGTNFCGATSVTINGIAATHTISSNIAMTVVVPSTTIGTGTIIVTNTVNVAANTFIVTSATPTITSFAPTSGPVGTSVVITGTNFTGATAVKFNGVSALFTVNSATQITATVPSGATTGTISVTNASVTGTSVTLFTVTVTDHSRTVSFSYSGNHASGNVSVGDGFNACHAYVPVYIQQLVNGNWTLLDTTATNGSGGYSTWVPNKVGQFRAFLRKLTLVNGAVCKSDASPVRHHA